MVQIYILAEDLRICLVENSDAALSQSKRCYYVLIQNGFICGDVWNFGFYKPAANLKRLLIHLDWIRTSAAVAEREWLDDDSLDKCGYESWLKSDDRYKNNPEKSHRVCEYLESFSIRPATKRLKMRYRQNGRNSLPGVLDNSGRMDLDVTTLRRQYLFRMNAVKIMKCLEFEGDAAAFRCVKKLEGVNDDLELASRIGMPLGKVSEICRPGRFLPFFYEHYPYAYEVYLKVKVDDPGV